MQFLHNSTGTTAEQRGNAVTELRAHTKAINTCVFTPDNTALLSASSDGTVCYWLYEDLIGDKVMEASRVFSDNSRSGVRRVTVSRDNTQFVTASFDRIVRIWDLQSNWPLNTDGAVEPKRICRREQHEETGKPDTSNHSDNNSNTTVCSHIVTTSKQATQDENRTEEEEEQPNPLNRGTKRKQPDQKSPAHGPAHTYSGHTGWCFSCDISPSNRLVVSGAGNPDYGLRLWDLEQETCVLQLAGNKDHVPDCAFSPDGMYLLNTATGHTLELWHLPTCCPQYFPQ
eukprot:TRINITY_DN5785_c0_g1_i8.p1 TRINITY_DN5785_c0_g1~~TRINITY_DN5785_c0_g1_i8.p1  ORF type:complete len:285 (-),score=44.02 TRINITY_DN5785_c0_g1_i8:675-1529(-)